MSLGPTRTSDDVRLSAASENTAEAINHQTASAVLEGARANQSEPMDRVGKSRIAIRYSDELIQSRI